MIILMNLFGTNNRDNNFYCFHTKFSNIFHTLNSRVKLNSQAILKSSFLTNRGQMCQIIIGSAYIVAQPHVVLILGAKQCVDQRPSSKRRETRA